MACCAMHVCFIFTVLSFLFTVMNAGDELSANNTEIDKERVLKFTLRSFPNQDGRWVTQVHLVREGFPKEGAVPRVSLSVEQNITKSSEPPRLVARLAVASRVGDAVEELESRRFSLQLHPPSRWFDADWLCRVGGQELALPSAAAVGWLRAALHGRSQVAFADVAKIFIGITNALPGTFAFDGTFRTVSGQEVLNGTEPLKASSMLCGVMHINENPYSLSFQNCEELLSFLCEEQQQNIPEKLNVGPWLKETDGLEDYVYDYAPFGGDTTDGSESIPYQSHDTY